MMWYLERSNDSVIYLWEKNSYSVGRKNKDIIIENDDSISRNHGLFTIKNNNLYITDLGSKYGTFIGSSKLTENEEKKLSTDNIIIFGLLQQNQSKFKVNKMDYKVVFSNVKVNEKDEQSKALDFLQIHHQNTWNKNCTHLIVSDVILTSKVLCALTMGKHIVNLHFFPDVVKAVKNNSKLPCEKDYIPEFNETLLNKNFKLQYTSDRKLLFDGITFVFLTEKCKKSLAEMIEITGGNSMSWQKQELTTEKLEMNLDKYIFIEDSTEVVNKESKIYKSFHNAIKFLQSTGRRSIPLQEIALAIIYNSKSENCNPQFNRAALLVPRSQTQQSEQILVYDTEYSSSSNSASTSQSQNDNISEIPSVIEPSFESDNFTLSNGIKRPLEPDTLNEPHKKIKINSQSCSVKISSNETTSKNELKINAVSRETNSTTLKSDESKISGNPFSRKRKAPINLNQGVTKKPFTNISNIELVVQKQKNTENLKETINVCKTLMNTSWLKKEINSEEIQIKEEPEDEEITKLNEMFKNSVIVKYCPIVQSTKVIPQSINFEVKNFKKFKKKNKYIQYEIIGELNKVIVGDWTLGPPEPEDDDEMDNISTVSSSSLKKQPPQRRKFKFCV